MKIISKANLSVDARVSECLKQAMGIYLNQIDNGIISIGLESTFQMHLSKILTYLLDLNTYFADERFSLHLEKKTVIKNHKNYVDISINYRRNTDIREYFVELKFKKKSDMAPDLGNIESYIDIYNLDRHKQTTINVKKCYFIFLTDYEVYTTKSKKGTRKQLPMEDGCLIKKNQKYIVTGKSAKSKTVKYPSGFTFNNDYQIEYNRFDVKNKPYWYFILEI